MRVRSIGVRNLFDTFTHSIDLDAPERIRILHGPNGFGKTTILRMVNDFFSGRYTKLRAVPFQEFRIDFDDDRTVAITRKAEDEASTLAITLLNGRQVLDTTNVGDHSPDDRRLAMHYLAREVPGLIKEDPRSFRYAPTGEELSVDEAIHRFAELLPVRFRGMSVERDWLKELTKHITVRLIESQRLQFATPHARYASANQTREQPEAAVSVYARELATTIRSTLAEYGALSQTLDRTFPRRVIAEIENPPSHGGPAEVDDIRVLLNRLEARREKLRQVGLLDRQDDIEPQPPTTLQSTTQKVLSIYVEDTTKKLNVFNRLAAKIDLFQQIIGSKFFNKRLTISREAGFQVEVGRPGGDTKPLKVTQLSTGEQHMLVLIYELLFRVPANALVMIDEPEISLHVAWQQEFLHDLEKITNLANFDVLIATHSPQIIHDRWDLTQELTSTAAEAGV